MHEIVSSSHITYSMKFMWRILELYSLEQSQVLFCSIESIKLFILSGVQVPKVSAGGATQQTLPAKIFIFWTHLINL